MERATKPCDGASKNRRPATRDSKSDPRRPRSAGRRTKSADFEAFADDLRLELDPRGPLERLMTDHVVHSAWRLKATLARQSARIGGDHLDPDSPSPKRAEASAADRAARSVRDALESLDSLRSRPGRAAVVSLDRPEVVPVAEIAEAPTEVDPFASSDDWRERLAFDPEVSELSPVVKGTWVTVGHVVSLIVDGLTWADILRSHPELTEDDIRTCVAYAVAEGEMGD